MKNDCNIVRDLMPLVIDGVASEESTQMVTEHVKDCEPCAKVYEELKSDLPQPARPMNYEEAAKALRKWRRVRKTLLILLTMLITVVVLVVAGMLAKHLSQTTVMVDIGTYNVQFLMFEDQVQPISVYTGMDGVYGWGRRNEYDLENGTVRIKYYVNKGVITYPWEENNWIGDAFVDNVPCTFVDGQMMLSNGGEKYTVTEIVLTDEKNERVIYRTGDTLPAASDELRAYYWAVSDYNYWRSRRDKGIEGLDLEAIDAGIAERKKNVEALFELVPEFQPE